MMTGTKSLLSVFIIFSALSALAASQAWSHRAGHPTTTPKPVSVCEDCCGRNPSRPECAYTDCECSLFTKRPPVCKTCCSDKASTLEICSRVRCDCSIFRTTTTARPAGGCTTCCGPERFTAEICKDLKCNCLLTTAKPPIGRCGICCDPAKAKRTPKYCANIKCNCPSRAAP